MSLKLQNIELRELLEDFNVLTGIRIVLYDADHNELTSYPLARENFCTCMRQNKEFDSLCCASDHKALDTCRQKRALHIYRCHAGLIEATVPIMDGERIIGYLLFGQITDNPNHKSLLSELEELCKKYGIEKNLDSMIGKLKYRSEKQIRSASKIMEACAAYVRMKEIVRPSGKELIDSIGLYVDEHIDEEITIERICRRFSISRTRLYDAVRPYTDGGVAAYIRNKRLEYAKKLITTTDLSISEVASLSGFSDYNYFLRLFKKKFGVSSKKLSNSSKKYENTIV